MKYIYLLILLLFTSALALAQGEADNWYFGQRAAIRFNSDGTATPIPESRLVTTEGCSSISDKLGNLLFYTDGRNVWNSQNEKMLNGNYTLNRGLMGDPSSTQSAIIVPKKGDPDIYYIFTVDEPHNENAAVYPNQFTGVYNDTGQIIPDADDGFNNGLNYSVVDLEAGDVTTRNVHLLTYDPANPDEAKYKCSEKITAVKTANGSGFWVISHFRDKFYSFKVDAAGVNTTPVITQIEPMISETGYRRNSIGYLKASPDGKKLAIAHMQRGATPGSSSNNGTVYLYDFNDATGEVSNPIMISNFVNPYGLEFSAEAKKLYVTYNSGTIGANGLVQYDLLSANIPQSKVTISTSADQGALQLGPNKKIYRSNFGSRFLDVINFPEEDGLLCGFDPQAQLVGTTGAQVCTLGLPPFITSLFSASILASSTCLGQPANFSLNVNSTFDSVTWNFGDGSPTSSAASPTHTYQNPGTYNVIADVVKDGETSQVSSEISVSAVPVASPVPPVVECDPDNNNSTAFTLQDITPAVLGTQSDTDFVVRYFLDQQSADANTQAIATPTFNNTTNPQNIVARIQNKNNPGCYATTTVQLVASGTPQLGSTTFSLCDDAADSNDTNGQVNFNLAAVTQALVQNNAQFTTTYYATEPDAQVPASPLPQTFYNTTPNQQVIYARIENTTFPSCFTIVPVTLTVTPLPPAATAAALVQCDLGIAPDGLTQFNLTEADGQLTGGTAGLTVTYYATAADVQNNGTPLSPMFSNTSNPQQIVAKVSNSQTGCYRITPVTLTANVNVPAPLSLEACDDDGTTDGLHEFTLTDAGLENPANSVVYYASANDALLEQSPVTASFTNTIPSQQSVYARVETNNACTALQEIKLFVRPQPDIDLAGEAVVCLNTDIPIPIDAGVNGSNANYRFLWSTGETTETIMVSEPGTYTVEVIDKSHAAQCPQTRTVIVTASDVATVTGIYIKDLSDNNTVTVHVQPGNNVSTTYLYSLNLPDGPYQESNIFIDVPAGIHTLYVYDTQRCGVISKEIAVLSVPKFFTPNGDGVNETWNIIGVNALFYAHSTIYVFDRFGKMLANIDPRGKGWNGIYNGVPLPATDYWYVVQLDDGRTVKGHFSILR